MRDLAHHQHVCKYAFNRCPYNCGAKVSIEQLAAHTAECEFRPVKCPACSAPHRWAERFDHRKTCIPFQQRLVEEHHAQLERLIGDTFGRCSDLVATRAQLRSLRVQAAQRALDAQASTLGALLLLLALVALVAQIARPDASVAVALYLLAAALSHEEARPLLGVRGGCWPACCPGWARLLLLASAAADVAWLLFFSTFRVGHLHALDAAAIAEAYIDEALADTGGAADAPHDERNELHPRLTLLAPAACLVLLALKLALLLPVGPLVRALEARDTAALDNRLRVREDEGVHRRNLRKLRETERCARPARAPAGLLPGGTCTRGGAGGCSSTGPTRSRRTRRAIGARRSRASRPASARPARPPPRRRRAATRSSSR